MKARYAAAALLLLSAARGPDTSGIGYTQHVGAALPFDTIFKDEAGRSITLAKAMADKPTILAPVYFHCPSLCGVVQDDLFFALSKSGLSAGRDYALVAFSIDPDETPAQATAQKTQDIQRYPGFAPNGVHFLTGTKNAIAALTDAIGFSSRYAPDLKQFIHPAGLVFATANGRISSYMLGVGYHAGDVRAALLRAGNGGFAKAALPVLLLCFHFDASTGRYSLEILKVLRLAAGLFLAMLVAGIVLLQKKKKKALLF